MGRQRTINDQNFWRSAKLQNSTTEDKVAALHLLTCPDSNVIGGFSLVPRIAAAEIGWTPDQWRKILERLKKQGIAYFDATISFVWVKNWWDHHSPSQTLGPKLRNKTLEQILQLPEFCRQEFLTDFRKRISEAHRKWLDEALQNYSDVSADSNQYSIDTISASSTDNCNYTNNSILTSTTTDVGPHGNVDISGIPISHQSEITKALEKALHDGVAKANPQEVINVISQKFKSKNPPKSPGGLAYHLVQILDTAQANNSTNNVDMDAFEDLRGRCFAWPADNPNQYARIGEFGEFELFGHEAGRFMRRVGNLKNCDLIDAIQRNYAQEISPEVLNQIIDREAS